MIRSVMSKWCLTCCAFVCLSNLPIASAQEEVKLIDGLQSRSIDERYDAALKIHRLGKSAIPLLIDNVSRCDLLYLRLENPITSFAHPEILKKNCSGLIYAYMIELILARPHLIGAKGKIAWVLGDSRDYIYKSGIILTDKGNTPSPEQMNSIKQAYAEWWEKNKMISLGRLQQDWNAGIRPLFGTIYQWK